MRKRTFAPASLALLAALSASPRLASAGDDAAQIEAGRRIYTQGALPSGEPLRGRRDGVGEIRGREAACVACHRPSGLGSVEGNTVIPPVSGRAIFGGGEPVTVRADRRYEPGVFLPHPPYDLAGFAAALREGRHLTGRALDKMMPRYDLADAEVAAVAAYLKTLSAAWSPGVSASEVRLATVIAPGVPAERRQAFIDTLNAVVAQINVNVAAGLRQKVSIIERREHSRRKWALDVWQLEGPPLSWPGQLERRQKETPVFAILSGLGQGWQPVHEFCERSRVVCWFPSIDTIPQGAEQGNFGLYFSRGARLEADVAAAHLLRRPAAPERVVQLVSGDEASREGAAGVRQQMKSKGIAVFDIPVGAPAEGLNTRLRDLKAGDAVVLWLRPQDMSRLQSLEVPPDAEILLSGLMAGGESVTMPAEWRRRAIMIQPLEAPALREANLGRFSAWLRDRKLARFDERMQSEVYFAANFLWSAMSGMLNNLHTDYLVERAEATLSMREALSVQEEMQAMMMGGGGKGPAAREARPASAQTAPDSRAHIEAMMKRRGTTAYPRLSLAVGQRVASQGAYLETLDAQTGIVGDPEWVVP